MKHFLRFSVIPVLVLALLSLALASAVSTTAYAAPNAQSPNYNTKAAIRGQLFDTDGRPLSGVHVEMYNISPTAHTLVDVGDTDQNGRFFSKTWLPRGQYDVWFAMPFDTSSVFPEIKANLLVWTQTAYSPKYIFIENPRTYEPRSECFVRNLCTYLSEPDLSYGDLGTLYYDYRVGAISWPPPAAGGGSSATVTSAGLHLRSGPGIGQQSLGTYNKGTLFAVLSKDPSGAWLQVKSPGGKVGWMSARYLKVELWPASIPPEPSL